MLASVARECAIKAFVVTGVQRLSGATSAAQNVALQLGAACGLKVLVIEFSPQGRGLAHSLKLDASRQLADVAGDPGQLQDSVQISKHGVSVLVDAAVGNGDVADRLNALACVMKEAANHYDIVLIDAPPATDNAITMALGRLVPHFVLVVGAGRVKAQLLDRLKVELDRTNIEIVGVILNRHKRYIPKWVYRVLS